MKMCRAKEEREGKLWNIEIVFKFFYVKFKQQEERDRAETERN